MNYKDKLKELEKKYYRDYKSFTLKDLRIYDSLLQWEKMEGLKNGNSIKG